MTMPTLIVEVGFTAALTGTALHLDDTVRGILDTATLASDSLFVDVTQYVTSVQTRRGATRADGPTLRYEAGTATISFRNDDRRFDPTNLAGPYVAGGVTQVEPLRAVRIRATWNGETFSLWRGFTDQWTVNYEADTSTATVTCFDAFGIFAAYDRNAQSPVGAGETTGARIGRILTSVGWPTTDRKVDTGDETTKATDLSNNVLTELLLTTDTELGGFWMDAKGRAVFRSRTAHYTDVRSVYPLGLFGDQVDDGVDTTINLITNPSLETGTTSWSTGGTVPPSIAQSATRAMFGTQSLLATWGTAGTLPHVRYDIAGLTVGREYTISVYLWVPSGSLPVTIVALGEFGGTTSTYDAWERISWSGTATATTIALGLWPVGTPVGGETLWIDGLQVEEGPSATDYVDGAQTLAEWDGVAHASTSRRLPELPYADVDITYDALSITNQVTAAHTGGTAQTVEDAASVSAYLTRSHSRTDLVMQSDPDALMWAQQVIARTSMPELRFASLLLKPSRDADRLWPQAFGREIGDRIRVTKRPPGGGDPITREAWVRGIEHQLGADLDWQTRLVLEQTPTTTTVEDTFTRTVSGGWGTADTGDVWSISGGTSAQYSVSSGAGRHAVEALNSSRRTRLAVSLTNVEVLYSCSSAVLAAGGNQECSPMLRIDPNDIGGTYYFCEVEFSTTAKVRARLVRRQASVETGLTVAADVGGLTHAANRIFWVRAQVAGSLIRMRVWQDGTTEPTTWTASATDTAITGPGGVGIRTTLDPLNSNTLPVNFAVGDFTARTLHAWA